SHHRRVGDRPLRAEASRRLHAWEAVNAHTRLLITNVATLAATLLVPSAVRAQAPRSQLGTVSQLIAGTHVEITYRRPVAHGRTLFGALVPWGRVWTPSADTAARIALSDAVEINGSKLAAGTYSVWAIPDSASWTIIFNSEAAVFHLRYPDGR